jgi:non-specific serine/threonine protein kinase/serine/threonine-protein kinase
MIAPRFETLKDIFHAARELQPAERPAFLEKACGADEQLRREIEALLESDRAADRFIADPPAGLAAELFGGAEALSDVGRMVGQYKLLECVGAGGMGAVYLAERADQQFQMQVAIKLIKRGMDTASVLRRFQHERQILASLEHPNIARLLDGGTTEDAVPYFVMEYIKGHRIDRYAEEHRLSISERLELFRQVCGAVSYAHQHLVVHRDLKPSNILVTPAGVPKLLDFGIAKIIQPNDSTEALPTMTAVPIMTPEYASPEQIEGVPATTLSDVYSLGAVLYELLTGCPPYRLQNRSPQEIGKAISTAQIEKPSAAVTRSEDARLLRGDLDNIVRMAMRKETARRYRSVEQFSEDIRRHLAGRPVVAQPDTLSYRAAKFLRRNRLGVSAAALLLLTLVGGIVATAWQAHKARVHEQRARAEQARAERRFNEVRNLARSVLFDYHDAIKDLPGSTPVRARLVRDALDYLDRLATEAHDDQSLQRELGSAYERVGDVQGGIMFANLGDTAGAIESYRKSLRIREALMRSSPNDFQTRRDLAVSYRKLGLVVWETGDMAGGLENNRKALALFEALAGERGGDLELRLELVRSYDYVGLILQEQGDVPGALAHYGKALEILESFPPTDQKNEKVRRAFSVVHEHTGTALLLKGDLNEALEHNAKALAARATLSAEFPLNADYRRTLVVSHYNHGEILGKMGRDREALESYRNDLAIAEELSTADPRNHQYRDDRAFALIRIGDMLAKLGDLPQALTKYRESLILRAEDVKADPSNLWKRASLIDAQAKSAKTSAKMGERDAALAGCTETLSLMENTSVEPTNAQIRSFFADTYADLAEAYSALASDAEGSASHQRAACDMYRRSLEILADMRNRGILSEGDAKKPEAIAQQIIKCDSPAAK